MDPHDHLTALLSRLKLGAMRDQLDSLIDEAGRRELTIREALTMFCEREVARRDQRRIDMDMGSPASPLHATSRASTSALSPRSIRRRSARSPRAASSPTVKPFCCSGRQA